MSYFFGALKPKTDVRDYRIAAAMTEYPETFLCENLPPIKNQWNVNSCVAHAMAAILETFNKAETGQYIKLSTNFIYGMQGVAYGRLQEGMYLRDACKIVKNYGDPSNATVGGNTEQPKCTEKLHALLNNELYKEAQVYRVDSYARCKTNEEIKYALKTYGPLLGSIKWYNKYKLKDKVINFDKSSKFGHHAIMICGWNKEGWICQNSWGKGWNGDGRFIYPYEEQFAEAWSFVDANNNDIIIPKNNTLFDYIYKLINFIINIFKR